MVKYSKAFLKHAKKVGVTIPQLFKFKPAKTMWYPLITGRGFKDVRSVFKQTSEEDKELYEYYNHFVGGEHTPLKIASRLCRAVNMRVTYNFDKYNWGKTEYWAKPIQTHRKQVDDCDGYAVLLCKLMTIFGVDPDTVYVAYLTAKDNTGRRETHALCLLLDPEEMKVYALEGSWHPTTAYSDLTKKKDFLTTERYESPIWITNEFNSYSRTPWFRFIR